MNSIKLKTKTCPNLVNVNVLKDDERQQFQRPNAFKIFTNSVENVNAIDKDIIDLSSSSSSLSSSCNVMSRSFIRSSSSEATSRSCSVSSATRTMSNDHRRPQHRRRARIKQQPLAAAERERFSSECSLFSLESNSNKLGLLPVKTIRSNHIRSGTRTIRNYVRLSRVKKDAVEKGAIFYPL